VTASVSGIGNEDDAGDSSVDSPRTLPAWVFPWPELRLDWSRSALLVVDLQNYDANPRVGVLDMLARENPEIAAYVAQRVQHTVLPNVSRLIDGFRARGRDVIYTRHGALMPDGRDLIARRQRRNDDARDATGREAMWSRGSYEHEIVDGIEPLPDELVIDKNSSSPFNGTGIDQLLRNLGLTTLVVTGVATDMCVETTARDAADRGYDVIVVEDASATYYHRHHVAALSAIARVYGQVWSTEAVLDALTTIDRASREQIS
jgi:nicotinamidase-related amidase